MKIIYKQGDLLECSEKIIIHDCNAQGVMGSGVAAQIKKKYPNAARAYFNMKENNKMQLGNFSYSEEDDGKTIINAITQEFYGRNPHVVYVSYAAIAHAFHNINDWCELRGYKEIALPKIGAGLANGDWNIIERIIETECADVQPVVYVPYNVGD